MSDKEDKVVGIRGQNVTQENGICLSEAVVKGLESLLEQVKDGSMNNVFWVATDDDGEFIRGFGISHSSGHLLGEVELAKIALTLEMLRGDSDNDVEY